MNREYPPLATCESGIAGKTYHKAAKVRIDGAVSALCFRTPRPINLERCLWTLRWEAVTCRKCLALRDTEETRVEPNGLTA